MNLVSCPHCKKQFEISEALTHQLKEEVTSSLEKKYEEKFNAAKQNAEELAFRKISEINELKLKNLENENREEKEKAKDLMKQVLELTKEIRDLNTKNEIRELEMEKKLQQEEIKIREEISKIEAEKSNLEIAEYKKQLEDTRKALEEANRKADQRSQQLQGEVLEIELEEVLRSSFPHDDIVAVGKGISGADIRHIVKSPKGFICGVILWEFKRTKDWSDKWIIKLKEDLRMEKANIPVIVSIEMPKEIPNGFGLKDGVWVCGHSLIFPLATLLRKSLLDVGYQKAISANRGEKADLLYNYVTSHEFQQQIENALEAYTEMKGQILKERAFSEKSWKQREAQAERILMSVANIVGSMQGRVGTSMPQIKGLDLPEIESGDNIS